MTSSNRQNLLIVCGEPSGDRAAARVLEELPQSVRENAFGVGGPHLKRAKLRLVGNIAQLTAFGVSESAKRLGRWLSLWVKLKREIARHQPAVALLVDAPEVNLPLARVLRASGARVVFYVGPQIWAWRRMRLGLLRQRVDVVALVLPFEHALYQRENVNAVFVGHPINDESISAVRSRASIRAELKVAPSEPLVALLPGSRNSEIKALARPMIEAAGALNSRQIKTVFAPAPVVAAADISHSAWSAGCIIPATGLPRREVLYAADAALIASGTATLEAALTNTPMAIVYRLDPLSHLAARILVDIPYIGLPNWIAHRKIVPELLQHDVTGAGLAATALHLLDQKEQQRQKKELLRVSDAMGGPGAAQRVAKLVCGLL